MASRDNPIVYLTRKTWEFSEGNRKMVTLYLILFIIANAINFFEPLIVGLILNTIQEQGINASSMPAITIYLSLFIVLAFGFWLFHGPARVIERNNAFLVRANYKKYLIDGVMDLPPKWHTDHHSGDTIDKIEKGTTALFDYSGRTFEVIESIIRLVGSYIALAYFNLHSIYIILFMVIITFTIILKFDKYLMKQYKELNRAENRISAKIFDTISNITTVIILRIEKLLSSAIYKKIMKPFQLFRKNTQVNEIKWFLVSLSSATMMFLVIFSYIFFNFKAGNIILVGNVYILYGYVQRISVLFFRFAYRYGDIVRERTAVMNAEEVSNEFKPKRFLKSFRLGHWKELAIKNLKFSYHTEEGANLHLDNISLTIKKGDRIALIGASGSGKTTLLKIIRDLYHPKSVEVFLDGKKLKRDFNSINPDITLIPQDPEVFSTTIKENITVGINHSMDYIKRFAKMARFIEVVNRLPKKYESSIVEKGVNLSGGEKQRLALARGLMASIDKEILLLDESTSSVDLKNELVIYKNIFRNFKNKTIIASIHKLHLLHLFDKIYFFKNGKIIAKGTFKELMRTSKEFREIWERYNKDYAKHFREE